MIIKYVKCDKCSKIMKEDSDGFYTINGNVYVGLGGGLIGNNLGADGNVNREQHFCVSCFYKLIDLNEVKNYEIPEEDKFRY